MPSLIDHNDMADRYDARVLGKLVDDTGKVVARAELANNEAFTAAINGATGEVRAAIRKSDMYTDDQINALVTANDTGLAFLKDIVCAVAMSRLWKRRRNLLKSRSEKSEASAAASIAEQQLRDLASGAIVLEVSSAIEAGKIDARTITSIEVESNFGLAVDNARGRFFPRRRSYRGR